jgi:transcriptional regulator with XRE-family HTH domain
LLKEAREKNNWTYIEVVEKLGQANLSEKDVRKWEIGLKYPDLDMIYKLSELYEIPSTELIQAKNNSFEAGMGSINKRTIKLICYFLNVSYHVGLVLLVIIYIFLLIAALWFLTFAASKVDKNLV